MKLTKNKRGSFATAKLQAKRRSLLAIAVIFAVIGFMTLPLTGCPDGGDDTKPAPKPEAGPPPAVDPDTPITSVAINVASPAKGGTPATTATASGTVNFTSAVTWAGALENDKFKGGEIYTATVTLTANSGFTFTGLTTATVNNNSVTATENTGGTVKFVYTFPITLNGTVSLIQVSSQPTKKSYTQDEPLDLTGMVVKISFLEGGEMNPPSTLFETYGITTNPAIGAKLSVTANNGKPITVTMGDLALPVNTDALTVTPRAPTADDFIISGATTVTYDGTAKSVNITAAPAKTSGMGAITVKYDGNATAINAKTSYAVTFDVAGNTNYNAASGFSAGTLTINKATPVLGDYDTNVTPATQFVTKVSDINITATATKKTSGLRSDGAVTVYYEGTSGTSYTRSATKPNKVGTFAVTFDVAGTENWNAATISAGTLEINVFKAIADLGTWLGQQTANTAATAFPIALNVSSFGGTANQNGSIGATLLDNKTKNVTLDLSGSTVTAIPNEAFLYSPGLVSCTNLVGITIGNSVTSIGNYAFYGASLASATIGSGSIGDNAFSDCRSLASVTIGNSVTTIGQSAFLQCGSLTSVTFEATSKVTSIRQQAFLGCNLASVTIPASVTSIGDQAFSQCNILTSVTFATGSNISNFGNNVFPEGSNGQGGNNTLKTAYNAASPKDGTYTRAVAYGDTWSKQ
jgi:hypothetical protein